MSQNLVITRNNKPLTLSTLKILKGKNEGTQYQAPVVTADNLSDFIEWAGPVLVAAMLSNDMKKKFQTLYFDCFNEEGVFNEPLFVQGATDLTTGGYTLSEINDKLTELMEELDTVTNADGWDEIPENRKRVKELSNQMKAFKQMREDRQRKKKDEAEKAEPAVTVS